MKTGGMSAVNELTLEEINSKFVEYVASENNAVDAANFVYENLLEDATLGVLFDFHHGLKTGLTDLMEGEPEDEESILIVNSAECDVFGFSTLKKTTDSNCSCPNCDRPVSATRFAPHLEKCMGMGRNSSRIASRRIASNSREPTSYAGLLSDDDDDADWASAVGDKRRRRMRNHNHKKPNKIHNGGRSNGASADLGAEEALSAGERKQALQQMVNDHTKKSSTSRSTREEGRRLCSTPAPEDASSPAHSEPSPSSSCSSGASNRRRDRHRARNIRDNEP